MFHTLPRHDLEEPIELSGEERERWQDREHLVKVPGDAKGKFIIWEICVVFLCQSFCLLPTGIVGHLEKEWENEHTIQGDRKVDPKAPQNKTTESEKPDKEKEKRDK